PPRAAAPEQTAISAPAAARAPLARCRRSTSGLSRTRAWSPRSGSPPRASTLGSRRRTEPTVSMPLNASLAPRPVPPRAHRMRFTKGVEVFTNWHTWQRTEPELPGLLPAATCDAVAQAVEFALRFHGDQQRPTGAPYVEHLLEALEVLVRGAGVSDPGVLCATVLHDVVEDTPCTIGDVRSAFGDRVAEM